MNIYGMVFLSLTNIKNSNKDFNWGKQNLNCKEVYIYEWEFSERRETVRALIVNW